MNLAKNYRLESRNYPGIVRARQYPKIVRARILHSGHTLARPLPASFMPEPALNMSSFRLNDFSLVVFILSY